MTGKICLNLLQNYLKRLIWNMCWFRKLILFLPPTQQQCNAHFWCFVTICLEKGYCWWECKKLQEEWQGGVRTWCWGGSLYIGKKSLNIWTSCNWRQTKFQPQLSPLTHYTPKYFSPRVSRISSNQGLKFIGSKFKFWVQEQQQCFILMRQPQLGDKTLSGVLILEKCKKGILSVSHFITSYLLLKCEMTPTIKQSDENWISVWFLHQQVTLNH